MPEQARFLTPAFMFNPINIVWTRRLMRLVESGADARTVKDGTLRYSLFNSRPMAAVEFTRDSKEHLTFAFHVATKLHELGVDVRRTVREFLWLRGMLPQSQLAKCVMVEGGGYVFLDVVGPNLNGLELLDSLFHEAVHATGPTLGRWGAYEQPSPEAGTHEMGLAYLEEEAIALCGAMKMMATLCLRHAYTSHDTAEVLRMLVLQHGLNGNPFSASKIEFESDKAMTILLAETNYEAKQARYERERFSTFRHGLKKALGWGM